MKADEPSQIFLYDTTLRDGTQRQGMSLSVDDKLKITSLLDSFGVHYIEGGWPGSNPKDVAYFSRVKDLTLSHAKVVAFGSTRRAGVSVEDDENLRALLAAGTPAVALVGKSWTLHVDQVLRISREENLKLIYESINYVKHAGREVIYDAEHFFDGYRADPSYAYATLEVAQAAGAEWIVLCDTNGGTLPHEISQVVCEMKSRLKCGLGIHTHNDAELAVANTLAGVASGARQIQGTINGYGERCGNANLISLIPTLQFKLGYEVLPRESLKHITELSRTVAEIANLSPDHYAPYVGKYAFAHKGGIHVAAVERIAASYEHMDPTLVGNDRAVVVSELSGRGNIRMTAARLGLGESGNEAAVLNQIKDFEGRGYQFENAEGTVELMIRRSAKSYSPLFSLQDVTVLVCDRGERAFISQAVLKLNVGGELVHTVAEGVGPVSALDFALRNALSSRYPEINEVRLSDYKVRILDPEKATDAMVRVHIEATAGEERWTTVGCARNIIHASWEALADSIELYLLRKRAENTCRSVANG